MHRFVNKYLEPFFCAVDHNLAVRFTVSCKTGVYVNRRENGVGFAGRALFWSLLFKRCHIKINIETLLRTFFVGHTCNDREPNKRFICVGLIHCCFCGTSTAATAATAAITHRNMRLRECDEIECNHASVYRRLKLNTKLGFLSYIGIHLIWDIRVAVVAVVVGLSNAAIVFILSL